jgi:cell division protein FtsI (penicillin-binding protein 3)
MTGERGRPRGDSPARSSAGSPSAVSARRSVTADTRPQAVRTASRARPGVSADRRQKVAARRSAPTSTERSASRAPQPVRRPVPSPRPKPRRPKRPPRTVRLADPRRRLHVALVLICVLLSLFAGRLVQLQGLDASTYVAVAGHDRLRPIVLPAQRGPILDRDGQPLARSTDAFNVTADQTLVTNPAAYALQLDGLLDADARSIQRILTGEKRFQYVAKKLTPQTWRAIDELDLQGIYAEPAAQREYPAGAVAGNVVGFVGAEGHGLAGVELAMQSVLTGADGERACQLSPGGHCIPLGNGSRRAPVPGDGVRLTLDRDVQWYAEQALARQVATANADAGNVVVMDTRTFEIVAMATSPAVDPGEPGATDEDDRGNRVVEDAYEPGSVFKPLTMAAVIEEGKATPGTVLSVPDHIERSGEVINDYYGHGEEQMTLAGVLAKSSNVGTLLAAERIDKEAFREYLDAFGLGARPGLGLPGESAGRLPKEWADLTRDTIAFGQGVSVSTMQMATAYATIANGGLRLPARLVDATIDADGTETAAATGAPIRVVSEQTAAAVTLMMEAVMGEDGTGHRAAIDGYRVAGKTGTAQRVNPSCGCYEGYNSSFMGFAPADDPRYVVVVSVLNPRNGNSGGALAGPVFADVMGFTLAHMGVAPSGAESPDVPLFAD